MVAHPDDETIGAGVLLARLPGCTVVHLTDGVPRDLRWAPAARAAGWDGPSYGRARRRELTAAMGLAGVPPERLRSLGAVDQEVVLELPALAPALCRLIGELAPEVILASAYEGGHPDHDAAALAVRAALALAARPGEPDPQLALRCGASVPTAVFQCGAQGPALVELALYHAAPDGSLVAGDFLPGPAPWPGPATLVLSAAESRWKRRMIDLFATQAGTLAPFGTAAERFRPAPPCDFTRPPHPGRLWYERLGFPLTGERWREQARRAVAALNLPAGFLAGSLESW